MKTVKVDASILKKGMKVNLYSREEMDQLYTLISGTNIVYYKEFVIGIAKNQFKFQQVTIENIYGDSFKIEENSIELLFPIGMIKSIVDNTNDWDDIPEEPQDKTNKIKPGDIVKAINTSLGNAIIEGHYYLVKSIKHNIVNLELDSNGSVKNGWEYYNFIKVKSEKLSNPSNGKVIAIKTASVPNIIKGKQYQLSGGHIIDDNPFGTTLEVKDYPLFRRILDNEDDWEEPEVNGKEEELPPIELRDVDVKTECKMMKPMPILLEGPVGTGKTTILMELAEELGIDYYANVLTDQTSASEFKGYKNAMNGEFVQPEFRKAFEYGGMYVLEELNAATSNMPIIFNTIENGYFVFADKLVYAHKDFWLCATMNTITNAKDFGGRRTLDKSVRDRFHVIYVDGDINSRFKRSTVAYMEEINKLLDNAGITERVTPRDMRRFEHMVNKALVDKEVALKKCFIKDRINVEDETLIKIIKDGGEWL